MPTFGGSQSAGLRVKFLGQQLVREEVKSFEALSNLRAAATGAIRARVGRRKAEIRASLQRERLFGSVS